jgi:DNA (cytosine-5)-methyltransferase 3A
MIKILLGGSPCTFWSIAQKNNRETEAEGLGWELFKNYLIAREKFKPDFFLYENNKSAAQPIKDQISSELGVDLMYINSSLVSAQNRERFYCFNWSVDQPEDRGLFLRDILETGVTDRDKARCVTASVGRTTHREYLEKHQNTVSFEPVGIGWRGRKDEDGNWKKRYESNGEPKANALTTATTDSMIAEPVNPLSSGKARCVTAGYSNKGANHILESNYSDNPHKQTWDSVAVPIRVGGMPRPNGEISTSQAKRVYSVDGKSVNLTAHGGGEGAKTGMYSLPVDYYYATPVEWDDDGKPTKATSGANGKVYPVYEVVDGNITVKGKQYPIKLRDGFYIIRKLTPIECERLQTLPDGYTRAVSDSQRYKGLGNGWTAEVIIHILNGALKDVPRDEEIVVLSMYDGIGTGRYCLDKMGFTNVKYFAYEIDKYAKQISMSNYPDIIQCGDAFDIRHPDWTIGY